MEKLPREVFFIVGQFLTGKALVASMQVCRAWKTILTPIMWEKITRKMWYKTKFPIEKASKDFEDATNKYKDNLVWIQFLEWYDKDAIRGVFGSTPFDKTKAISKEFLLYLLKRMPNISTLILNMRSIVSGEDMLTTIKQLPLLTSLSADFPVDTRRGKIRLEGLFPLFAGLDELDLGGRWHRTPGTQDTPIINSAAWKLKKLTIERGDLCLLQHCPDLRELRMKEHHSAFNRTPYSLRPLLNCPRLEVLELPKKGRRWELQDLIEVLSTMDNLRRLSFTVESTEQADFLIDHGNQDAPAGMPLPSLEHLEVIIFRTGDQDIQEFMIGTLAMRTGLHSLRILDTHEVPCQIFDTNEPWTCTGLEEFTITITSPSNLRGQERVRMWRVIYRKLGELRSLKVLGLRCSYIDKSEQAGFPDLEGARELKQLVLQDLNGATWTKDEILRLLDIVPSLDFLDLGILLGRNFDEITA
ncbi:hypothetical protein BGX29_011454 [Mortierella sp. GBA35]|nr:hypothetical protein BGX29_011454 [Mortierella sp. GBA35]